MQLPKNNSRHPKTTPGAREDTIQLDLNKAREHAKGSKHNWEMSGRMLWGNSEELGQEKPKEYK